MADMDAAAIAALRAKRKFKKFSFRGIDLDQLLDLSHEEFLNVVHVEQEITGDDTTVIDSVLKSYTEREYLLTI